MPSLSSKKTQKIHTPPFIQPLLPSSFCARRIDGNKLELIEQSLTHKLTENCKRITFQHSMIIPRVHITHDLSEPATPLIQVLVATTFKLYRLSFRVPPSDG